MQTFNNGQKNKEIQSIKVELHVSTNKISLMANFVKRGFVSQAMDVFK